MIPKNITTDHIRKAISAISKSYIPPHRKGRSYQLLDNGKIFPPKYVLSIANKYANGTELESSDFDAVEAKNFLIKKGFNVHARSTSSNNMDTTNEGQEFYKQLKDFLDQAKTSNLKTKHYISEYLNTKVKVSFGQGGAAKIPWISFLIAPNTTSRGIYPAYLYYKDYNILILAYGVSETNSPLKAWQNLDSEQTVKEYFEIKFATKPDRYGSSHIYKVYNVNDLPSKGVMESDLENMINRYKNQMEREHIKTAHSQDLFSINQLQADISQSGLVFSETIINRFIASLLSKPFVLLTGLSGSGKTKIAQSFVQWICEDKDQYKIIPIGSDWTNREPLLGYPNGLNSEEYILPDSGALNVIIEAAKDENQHKPYFLILDEMNLSHVERYFADFLSIMESDDKTMLYSGSPRKSPNGTQVPSHIFWPRNLFIIGTVNIDETTYMFSPKVLDRANTIEFRVDTDNIKNFFKSPSKTDLSIMQGKGAAMAQHFLTLAADNHIEKEETYTEILLKFFDELKKIGAEFGYRTAVEMLLLIKKLNVIGAFTKEESIDIAVMQKLLPKLHGSRSKISKVLDPLIALCLRDGKTFSIAKSEEVNQGDVLYPITFEKLVRMYKNALDNGFTSYAEA